MSVGFITMPTQKITECTEQFKNAQTGCPTACSRSSLLFAVHFLIIVTFEEKEFGGHFSTVVERESHKENEIHICESARILEKLRWDINN